jgi:hypothetical protein
MIPIQVCTQGTDFAPHLTYNSRAQTYQKDSASFIAAAFKGTPLPAKPTAPGQDQRGTTAASPTAQSVPVPRVSSSVMPPVAVPPKGPPLLASAALGQKQRH